MNYNINIKKKKIVGLGFSHDSENSLGFALLYLPRSIIQTSALIIITIVLDLIQQLTNVFINRL